MDGYEAAEALGLSPEERQHARAWRTDPEALEITCRILEKMGRFDLAGNARWHHDRLMIDRLLEETNREIAD